MKAVARSILLLCTLILFVSPQIIEAAAGRIVTGADDSLTHTKAFTTRTLTTVASFFAYPTSFNGGVRVAAGDVNGDGGPDIITGTGPGAAHVKAFPGNSLTEIYSFFPYGSGYNGGVYVAVGDVDGDGFGDMITGTDEGASPHVKAFSGATGAEIRSFFAYSPSFTGGVRVAAGDINGDGYADIITGTGSGAPSHVKAFDAVTGGELLSFFAYGSGFTNGVYVAAGDINGDGRADIITGADSGAAPHVKAFNGANGATMLSFFAYDPGFSGGVRVAAGDVDGDGLAEILTAPGSGLSPRVLVLDGVNATERTNFLAYPSTFSNGVFVAVAPQMHPRLEISFDSAKRNIHLKWPSGCLCDLESNLELANSRGWSRVGANPGQVGNRFEVIHPASQNEEFFRLNCDDEALP